MLWRRCYWVPGGRRPPLSIDISCPHGAQQQTRRTPWSWSNDRTNVDRRPLHRLCSACYADSANNQRLVTQAFSRQCPRCLDVAAVSLFVEDSHWLTARNQSHSFTPLQSFTRTVDHSRQLFVYRFCLRTQTVSCWTVTGKPSLENYRLAMHENSYTPDRLLCVDHQDGRQKLRQISATDTVFRRRRWNKCR